MDQRFASRLLRSPERRAGAGLRPDDDFASVRPEILVRPETLEDGLEILEDLPETGARFSLLEPAAIRPLVFDLVGTLAEVLLDFFEDLATGESWISPQFRQRNFFPSSAGRRSFFPHSQTILTVGDKPELADPQRRALHAGLERRRSARLQPHLRPGREDSRPCQCRTKDLRSRFARMASGRLIGSFRFEAYRAHGGPVAL